MVTVISLARSAYANIFLRSHDSTVPSSQGYLLYLMKTSFQPGHGVNSVDTYLEKAEMDG